MSRDPAGRVQRVESAGGPVMGVSADVEYRNESAPIPAGTRFVIFSDGVAEQGGAIDASVQFGWGRLHQCLTPAAHADGDVGSMLQALREHAGGNVFGDDVTIASIAVG
jgi:serine phosphatase RsbU (regulator of sigma subunit)